MTEPPGNSLRAWQDERVADPGDAVVNGLYALLDRVGEEIRFNDAKGSAPYRLGVHDALRFAEDAIVDLLRSHGHDASARDSAADA